MFWCWPQKQFAGSVTLDSVAPIKRWRVTMTVLQQLKSKWWRASWFILCTVFCLCRVKLVWVVGSFSAAGVTFKTAKGVCWSLNWNSLVPRSLLENRKLKMASTHYIKKKGVSTRTDYGVFHSVLEKYKGVKVYSKALFSRVSSGSSSSWTSYYNGSYFNLLSLTKFIEKYIVIYHIKYNMIWSTNLI